MSANVPVPRVFISYCWSSEDHQQWVLDLSNALTSDGIQVELDKWRLREGDDTIAFMERMVTDPTISKVLIICDASYVRKANERDGGVGTESQIISSQIYAKASQSKFVAVVAERDADNKPYLPVYCINRLYVDLSDSARYIEGYEKLLRSIYGKPLFEAPPLGKPPAFILDESTVKLATATAAKRVVEAFREGKNYAVGALDEYLELLCGEMPKFSVDITGVHPDETVYDAIGGCLPTRTEFLKVLTEVVRYGDELECAHRLVKFFESMILFLEDGGKGRKSAAGLLGIESDNYKFMIHEYFLIVVALLLNQEKFTAISHLFDTIYVGDELKSASNSGAYTVFRKNVRSLDVRNERLGLGRIHLRADLLKERCAGNPALFTQIMQADFVCYLRSMTLALARGERWYPDTLVHAIHRREPFELFQRAVSTKYALRVFAMLGIKNVGDLKERVRAQRSEGVIPSFDTMAIKPEVLMGAETLATRG